MALTRIPKLEPIGTPNIEPFVPGRPDHVQPLDPLGNDVPDDVSIKAGAENVDSQDSVDSHDGELSTQETWLQDVLSKLDKSDLIALSHGQGEGVYQIWSSIMAQGLEAGVLSISDVQSLTSKYKMGYSPAFEKYLNNLQAQENATTEYDREISARDTSITSTLNQLRDAQMSSSYLASVGGASAGVGIGAAQSDMSNIGSARALANFKEKASMARTLIGLVGGMASAGVYGGSMAAAKHAVAKMSTEASLAAVKSNNYTKLLMRRKGESQYDRFGDFISHKTYDY